MNVSKQKWQLWLSRLVSSMIVLALLVGALPQSAQAAAPAAAPAATAACAQNYTVKSGDTLSSIAAQFNVTTAELANENGLKDPYVIYVGQVLCIPGSATTSTSTTGTTTTTLKGFSITITGNVMTIKVSNYTKRAVFVVKAKPVGRGEYVYLKLGRVKTDKKGSGGAVLKLPKKLRNFDDLFVCFKNSTSDAVKCEYVSR